MLREEQQDLMDEQIRASKIQQKLQDDVSRLLNTVRKMVGAMARLEKRLPGVEILVEAIEPKCMLPPPLPLPWTHFQHVPTAHPAIEL